MTGYQIGLTKIRNFLPFEDAEFDFSMPGLTVVEGEIHGVPGCDSNGSGKSALIEAPVWALTGRCIRDRYRGDDVVRLDSTGGTCVDVSLVGGTKSLQVVRYRKDPKHKNNVYLYVDGQDVSLGTNVQTDKRIEEELGLDFDTFMHTVAFGARADVKSFFFATDSERKRILDRILGLEVFERAQTIARTRMREATAKSDPLHTQETNLLFRIDQSREVIASLEEAVTVDPIALKDQKILARRLALAVEDAKRELQNAVSEEAEEREKWLELVETYEELERALRREREQELSKTTKHESHAYARRRDATRLSKEADELQELDGSCPTCRQPVDTVSKSKVVAALRKRAAESLEAAAEAEKFAQDIRESVGELELPERPKPWHYEAAKEITTQKRSELAILRERLSNAERRYEELREQHDNTAGRAEKLAKQIIEWQSEVESLRDQQSVLAVEIEHLEFWVEAYGNAGIKSYVIESELPNINAIATNFARRLLGDGAVVQIKATRALKSKDAEREEMVVDARIPHCSESYAGASKGQRHRLDLSLILALREVVKARSVASFDQLFADELFDGVDSAGIDSVVEILQEVASASPVLLVTHDARLKSVGDRLVTVRHESGRATIHVS